MTPDVTYLAALIAGLVSFLSPCVLPLVPPYLVYLAGASLERLNDDDPRTGTQAQTVFAALLFVAGLSTVFVTLGAAASTIGSGLRASQGWLAKQLDALGAATGIPIFSGIDPFAAIAGIAIIIMGLHFLGITRIGILAQEKRAELSKPVGLWGAYAMGLAFAFGWTPCIGPILATILAVAAAETTVTKGASLLAVYSAGLGIPFLLAAFAVGPFARFLTRFRSKLKYMERVMGGLLVLTGIAFLTGGVSFVSFWLLEMFPALGTIG